MTLDKVTRFKLMAAGLKAIAVDEGIARHECGH